MPHPFQTVTEVGLGAPPGREDWLYVATFSPLLPDRFNVWHLQQRASKAFPEQCELLLDEPEPQVVVEIHVVIAPDEAVAAFVQEQLEIIERDGILDEAGYWALVNPIIQSLWEGESVAKRYELCRQAEIGADRALDADVPPSVHDVLYRQISI